MNHGMTRENIKRHLRRKLNGWIDSIEDHNLKTALRNDVIVSGGAIVSLLQGEPPNDYDVYFRTKTTTRWVAEYYANKYKPLAGSRNICVIERNATNIKGELEARIEIRVKSMGVIGDIPTDTYEPPLASEPMVPPSDEEIEATATKLKDKYSCVFISSNAITLAGKIQLVIRFYGEPAQIHNNYDFVHAMCYYDMARNDLSTPDAALHAILSKSLVYGGGLYPVASIFRLRKFLKRGWRISAGELLKIMFQISKIDLEDINILEDQLIGVDVSFMSELIQRLREHKGKLDDVYLAELIDAVFS
mgnify:CR=1 FL=1